MSRLLIATSLILAFTSFASADRIDERYAGPTAAQRWAQPPGGTASAQRRVAVAPRRVLDRDAVRAKLVANRAANLARFRDYRRAGVFPSNTYSDGKLNVWLDDAGHLCAAATIINASGQSDLVARTAEQNNFIRLADVTQGPLLDWILTSGLTHAEIVAIQEPMMRVYQEPVEPEPQPRVVDAGMRKTEDKRLVAKYREVDASIVRNQKASLELALDRLMARPALAWTLLDS